MTIIFNIYALIQALFLGIFLGILYIITEYFGFGKDIDGDFALVYQFMFATLITAYTDLKGIKGKLFYLPTWLIFIIVLILFSFQNKFTISFKFFIYAFSITVIIYYFIKYKRNLKKVWEIKMQYLNELKSDNSLEFNNSEYWKYLSNLYFKPSFLFLYFNNFYNFTFKNCINKEDFYNYYKYIINTIKTDEIKNNRYKNWVKEHQEALNKSNNFDEYSNPPFAFTRLANLIIDKN